MGKFRVAGHGGEWDLGPSQIPPQPTHVAMEDRVDGNTYIITHTSGTLSVGALPARWKFPTFGPHAGPYMDTAAGQVRLYMTSGVLTYEAVPDANWIRQSARVFAMQSGFNLTIYEVTTPGGFEIGDPLQLTQVAP